MLMPLLKSPATAIAPTATPADAMPQRERRPVVQPGVSGGQSQAALRILETLNRHLVGLEPLPKEALIRLLETLAKVLDVSPLPQESLRDFGKRLAALLETLPPAARATVEKQLQQRNVVVSLRILIEVLKNPPQNQQPQIKLPLAPPTQLDARPIAPPRPDRDFAQQVQIRPAPQPAVQTAVGNQPPKAHGVTNLPTVPSLTVAIAADSGLLQVALKKVFSDEDPIAIPATLAEDDSPSPPGQEPVASRGGAAPDKLLSVAESPVRATQQGTVPLAQSSIRAAADAIPPLRAAATFLAGHPEALALASAIASDDLSPDIRAEIVRELGLAAEDVPDSPKSVSDQPSTTMPFEDTAAPEPETLSDAESVAPDGEAAEPTTKQGTLPLPPSEPEADLQSTKRQSTVRTTNEPPQRIPQAAPFPPSAAPIAPASEEGLLRTGETPSHDVVDTTGSDMKEPLSRADQPVGNQDHAFATLMERPARILAETLKVLTAVPPPRPEAGLNAQADLLSDAMAQSGDLNAQSVFDMVEAALEKTSVFPSLPHRTDDAQTVPVQNDNPEIAEPKDQAAEHRIAAATPNGTDDLPREPFSQRLPDMLVLREAIPFAMIPYLPASEIHSDAMSVEEDDEAPSGDEPGTEDEASQEHGAQEHEDVDGEAAVQHPAEEDEAERMESSTYDVYRMMGGFV